MGNTFNISFQQIWKEVAQGVNEVKEKSNLKKPVYLNHATVTLHGEI